MKNKVRKILMILSCLISLSFTLSAQNPYLPLWEFIPDGEPYVFEDPDCPGKYRVYIYGSRDEPGNSWCSHSYNVLSSSDLVNWPVIQLVQGWLMRLKNAVMHSRQIFLCVQLRK